MQLHINTFARLVTRVFLLLAFVFFFIPDASLADNSCRCYWTTPVFSDSGQIVKEDTFNSCYDIRKIPTLNGQSDCSDFESKGQDWPQNASVNCVFNDFNCDQVKCKASICNKSDDHCSIDDECIAKTQGIGTATCSQGFCYYDTLAQEARNRTSDMGDITIKKPSLRIGIPGVSFSDVSATLDSDGNIYIPWIGEYIAGVYKYSMVIGSIIAVVMIIVQGFQIVMSAGGEQKSESYTRIMQIAIGLVVLWGSYAILYTINPELVRLNTLKIQFIKPEPLPERIGLHDDSAATGKPGGVGNVDQANATQCPALVPGTKFKGAFTTYWNLHTWGDPAGYEKNYKGSPSALNGKGGFFCAVAMECTCPDAKPGKSRFYTDEGEVCQNSKSTWYPCNYFDSSTPFCPADKSYVPGQTVAASTCFPKGTKIKIDDTHTVTVTDRGSGIIGTHFDLYLGILGDPSFVQDTSWLQGDNLEIVSVGGKIGDNELNRMRQSYERYKPGVCKPGFNC